MISSHVELAEADLMCAVRTIVPPRSSRPEKARSEVDVSRQQKRALPLKKQFREDGSARPNGSSNNSTPSHPAAFRISDLGYKTSFATQSPESDQTADIARGRLCADFVAKVVGGFGER
jgi:hypothetical protein